MANRSNYLFVGEQADADLGQLIYLRNRYFKSGGGFLTRDGFEGDFQNPLTLHKYGYAAQNPENYLDPSGNMFISAMLVGVAIVGILSFIPSNTHATAASKGEAWPHLKPSWDASDIQRFRDWVVKNTATYEGRPMDCANVALTLLIDFASANGLPVNLGSVDPDLNSSKTSRQSVGKFSTWARIQTGTLNVYDLTTDKGSIATALPAKKASSGDLLVNPCAECVSGGYTGHTIIFLGYAGIDSYSLMFGSGDANSAASPIETAAWSLSEIQGHQHGARPFKVGFWREKVLKK